MSMELTVSDLISLSLIFIVDSSSVFSHFNLGADFVVGTCVLEVFIIRFCEGRDFLVFVIQF